MFDIYKKINGEWVLHGSTYYESYAAGMVYQLVTFFGYADAKYERRA